MDPHGKASVLEVLYSPDFTCGEACWQAREDVCKCSCYGKNHGIRRNSDEQPERTRRIKGQIYHLLAIGSERDPNILDARRRIFWAAVDAGKRNHPHKTVFDTTASESETARWPELEPFRNGNRPLLLWVREDVTGIANSILT